MIQKFFQASPIKAIMTAYPGKFKEWEFPCVPSNFWTFENACKATKWMIEEKLQWNEEDIITKLTNKTFKDNGLISIIDKYKIRDLIDKIYPGKIKPWEYSVLPKEFWTMEMATEATRWLIEKKLGWSKEYALKNLRKYHFKEYGISYIFKKIPITIEDLIELSYK